MPIDIYINFNGNCRKAVEFYAKVFETEKPQIMTYKDAPPNPDFTLPDEAKDLVMHTELVIHGSRIMFSDVFPGSPFVQGNHINLAIVTDDLEQLTSQFNKIKENGKVTMELQETFWSKSYGQVTDQFGINWMFSLNHK